MNITEKRTAIIIEALAQGQHNVEFATTYGDRGYTQPEKGVLLANWNDISENLQKYLEEAGYELDWNDEYVIDYETGKAWRVSPDSYSFVCAVKYTDGGDLLTPDNDVSEWIDDVAIDDPAQDVTAALPQWITEEQIIAEGFTKLSEDFASGWYGTDDQPDEIARNLWENVEDIDRVVFQIVGNGQFEMQFAAYYSVSE